MTLEADGAPQAHRDNCSTSVRKLCFTVLHSRSASCSPRGKGGTGTGSVRLVRSRLHGHSHCHLFWARNKQGAGGFEQRHRRVEERCGGAAGGGPGPLPAAPRTCFSLFTAYTVFLITARYTHPKPPSPIFSASEKSWVPWRISWRGQQNEEGAPGKRDPELSGLGCGQRPRIRGGPVSSPLPRPQAPSTPSAPAGLAGAPQCSEGWVSSGLSQTRGPAGPTYLGRERGCR